MADQSPNKEWQWGDWREEKRGGGDVDTDIGVSDLAYKGGCISGGES